jgi:hypothetical protein
LIRKFPTLRITFSDLAATAREVTSLDEVCGYRIGGFWWTDLKPQAQADGRVLPNASPSPERLIQAAVEIEDRFLQLDSQITAPLKSV